MMAGFDGRLINLTVCLFVANSPVKLQEWLYTSRSNYSRTSE